MCDSYKQWLNNGCPKVYCNCGCGKEIIITKWHKSNGIPNYICGHSGRGKFRSIETKQKMRKSHKGLQSGKNHPMYGRHHTEKTKEKIRNNKPNCQGKNNSNYIDGRSFEPYCERFNEKTKERIRERDNRTCQLCGKNEQDNKQKLDVHHIHYDKENCYPDLISLCHKCNSKVNKNRNYWEEYFIKILERNNLLNLNNKKLKFIEERM